MRSEEIRAAVGLITQIADQTRLLALNDRLLTDGRKGLSVARSELRRVVL